MSGGGSEYKLMAHVRLMVLPFLTYTADSPRIWALAALKKRNMKIINMFSFHFSYSESLVLNGFNMILYFELS